MPEQFGVNAKPLVGLDGTQMEVPVGPIQPNLRLAIEQSVANLVPPGKKVAVVALVDPFGKVGKFQFAANLDGKGNWKFGTELEHQWGGDTRGKILLFGSF